MAYLESCDLNACQSNLKPEMIRIAPPLLPIPQGQFEVEDVSDSSSSTIKNDEVDCGYLEELIWLNPFTINHRLHWNMSIKKTNLTKEASLNDLITLCLIKSFFICLNNLKKNNFLLNYQILI